MATAEEAKKEQEARAVAGAGAGPKVPAGDPNASYVSPDLSFIDGIELDEERQAWAEERDQAREDGVKNAVESEKKILKLEAEAREEASEKAKEARDKQIEKQVGAGILPAPSPSSEEILAEKLGGKGTKASAEKKS